MSAAPYEGGPTTVTAGGTHPEATEERAAAEAAARASAAPGTTGSRLFALRVCFGLGLVGAWQLVATVWSGADDTISSPSAVASRLWTWLGDGTLLSNTGVTLKETALAFMVGAAGGIVAGIALGLMRRVGDVVIPYLMGLYSLPKMALAPLFILWFGIGVAMKVALGAVLVLFLVLLNTMTGVRDVDQGQIDSLKLMGASRWQVLWKLTLPSSRAAILLGIKLSVPYALIGAIVGELIASTDGLGFVVKNASAQYDTTGVFVCLVVLAILALVLNQFVEWLERWALAWKVPSR